MQLISIIVQEFFPEKIKNHLRIFEGHFGQIAKSLEAQAWVMYFFSKRNGVTLIPPLETMRHTIVSVYLFGGWFATAETENSSRRVTT